MKGCSVPVLSLKPQVHTLGRHCNMFSKSRFTELFQLFPGARFEAFVKQTQSDKFNKGFTSWHHLVSMMYAQLTQCQSLRELEVSFNAHPLGHYHIAAKPIKRSTLAEANQKRDSEVFRLLCDYLLAKVHGEIRREARELLCLIDSSPIPLKGRGYDWALENGCGRINGLKLHVQYLSDYGLPSDIQISEANLNDVIYGREISLERDTTYVFDKGYCDYNWWHQIDEAGSVFVTRFKKNAGVDVIQTTEAEAEMILKDEVVQFRHVRQHKSRKNAYLGKALRRITVDRPTHDTPLVIATNDMTSPAHEIADLYRRRWEIELWFKWIKQRLKIKRFLGQSLNAVKIQIYVALITCLLLHRYRKLSGTGQPFYLWLVQLRSTLFDSVERFARQQQLREPPTREVPPLLRDTIPI